MPLSIYFQPGTLLISGQPQTPEDINNLVKNLVIELQGAIDQTSLVPGTVNNSNLSADAYFYGNATLSGTAISFNANGEASPPAAYVAGEVYYFLPNFICPGGTLTVNVSGKGAIALKKWGTQNLQAADFLTNELCAIQYDGTNFQYLSISEGRAGRTLRLAHNTTGGTCAFTAYRLVFDDSSRQVVLANVNISGVSLSSSGAGGLDTGTAATSTWYYLWCIWDGTNTSGLLSLSSTNPTLPSGYLAKALICPVYNRATGGLQPQFGSGKQIWFTNPIKANSSLTFSTSTVTVTTSTAHGFITGQYVVISGVTASGYNGVYQITVTGTTTFTYALGSSPGTASVTGTSQVIQTVVAAAQASSSGLWSVLAAVGAMCPPIAQTLSGLAGAIGGTTFEYALAGDGNGSGMVTIADSGNQVISGIFQPTPFTLPCLSFSTGAPQIYYQSNASNSTHVVLTGYTFE